MTFSSSHIFTSWSMTRFAVLERLIEAVEAGDSTTTPLASLVENLLDSFLKNERQNARAKRKRGGAGGGLLWRLGRRSGT